MVHTGRNIDRTHGIIVQQEVFDDITDLAHNAHRSSIALTLGNANKLLFFANIEFRDLDRNIYFTGVVFALDPEIALKFIDDIGDDISYLYCNGIF